MWPPLRVLRGGAERTTLEVLAVATSAGVVCLSGPARWIPPIRSVRYKHVSRVPPTGAERWLAVRFWRIVWFLLAVLIVWLILTQPTTAANIVNDIFAILKTAATNVTSFFTQLLS